MPEAQMLPNGSYFYNTQTKRLHEGNFVEGVLTPPAGKEKSKFTFNLVPKEYPEGFDKPLQDPTMFMDVLRFPTTLTMTAVLAVVRDVVGVNPWSVAMTEGSKPANPKRPEDAPYVMVITNEGAEALLEAREIAYDLVEHDWAMAVQGVKDALKDQGLYV